MKKLLMMLVIILFVISFIRYTKGQSGTTQMLYSPNFLSSNNVTAGVFLNTNILVIVPSGTWGQFLTNKLVITNGLIVTITNYP